MSKRRLQTPGEREPETLTPEERREQRRRDRAKKKAGHSPAAASPWRKAAVVGVPVAVIAAIVVVLVVVNLPTPCLQFTDIANSSPGQPNEPTFPSSSQGGFSGTWCISSTPVYSSNFRLNITIDGTAVALPGLIGERNNYSAGICDLPLHTLTTPAAPGVVQIDSPWPYHYNLSMFFNVWSQSKSTAYVDASHPSQHIVYQRTNILGYSANTTESITLWVDSQPSRAGPDLDVTSFPWSSTTPSCLGKMDGTGHTILISYGKTPTVSLKPILLTPALATGLADPTADLRLYGGPLPSFGLGAPTESALAWVQGHGFAWLLLRVGP